MPCRRATIISHRPAASSGKASSLVSMPATCPAPHALASAGAPIRKTVQAKRERSAGHPWPAPVDPLPRHCQPSRGPPCDPVGEGRPAEARMPLIRSMGRACATAWRSGSFPSLVTVTASPARRSPPASAFGSAWHRHVTRPGHPRRPPTVERQARLPQGEAGAAGAVPPAAQCVSRRATKRSSLVASIQRGIDVAASLTKRPLTPPSTTQGIPGGLVVSGAGLGAR